MSTWQGAVVLAKEELRRIRWKHLLTVVFIGYLIIFLYPMFTEARKGEETYLANWAMDFIVISLLPILGLMSTQTSGFYMKLDSYTKKLASWRVMPITIPQMVLGRILTMLTNAIPALIILFLGFYLMSNNDGANLDWLTFIQFAFFWISFSITVGIIYLYFETGFTGKQYFWFCMIVVIALLLLMVLYAFTVKLSLFIGSYDLIENGGWWLTIAGAALLIITFIGGRKLMERKLRSRNYIS